MDKKNLLKETALAFGALCSFSIMMCIYIIFIGMILMPLPALAQNPYSGSIILTLTFIAAGITHFKQSEYKGHKYENGRRFFVKEQITSHTCALGIYLLIALILTLSDYDKGMLYAIYTTADFPANIIEELFKIESIPLFPSVLMSFVFLIPIRASGLWYGRNSLIEERKRLEELSKQYKETQAQKTGSWKNNAKNGYEEKTKSII